jgi:3-hydroxyisobutyrate dehydrogenase-like beta-hydroxyacid dehydrogenase
MAANLARAGTPLAVYNRTARVAKEFAAEHAVVAAPDLVSLTSDVDVVITMLSDEVALAEVMHGPDGVLAALRPGTLIVDMGTVGRDAVLSLAQEVTRRGCRLIDAPVSGVPKVAAEARLLIMAGGEPDDIERARPILEVLSERIIHVGPMGAGAAMKLAINTAIHGLNQALSEALVLAERCGIDRHTAYEVFVNGAISGPFVVNRRAVFERPGEGPQPFSVQLAAKDIRLTLDLADAVGAPLEQARLNHAVLMRAAAVGFADQDESAVAEYLRRIASAARSDGRTDAEAVAGR